MIVFSHTKFGLVEIKGSGVKGGGGFRLPQPERVFEIPAWIGLKQKFWSSVLIGKIEDSPKEKIT